MTKIKLVTGYVPIPNHPRTASEYGELGEQLAKVRSVPVRAFYKQLSDCWLHKLLENIPIEVTHSTGDNPKKNTMAYHIVQHQKSEFLREEARHDTESDVFVWMDYGICHQPGVTPLEIEKFLTKVAKDDFALPGCWERPVTVSDSAPCWRFCGSMVIVPRQWVEPFANAVMAVLFQHLKFTRNVPWEVNTWTILEQSQKLPMRWYKADHNETQFTNYEAPNDNVSGVQDAAAGGTDTGAVGEHSNT